MESCSYSVAHSLSISYAETSLEHPLHCNQLFLAYSQGSNANKKGVGTHSKNSHFKTVSNSFQSKTCERCGNVVPAAIHPCL